VRSALLAVFTFVPLFAADTSFDTAVRPLLTGTCLACHNERLASGGLNVKLFADPQAITEKRDAWELIIRKLKAGEMPPKGFPHPPQERIDALVHYVEGEFDKADHSAPPDPGRVIAHRLNRNEYSNTVRDLLGVEFRAEKDLPTDDSGFGFDNIGEVLTISPVLMEKYMDAAQTIASRAIGADPLPKPFEVQYHIKDKTIRRVDFSTIEAAHRIDYGGEYTVRFGLPGQRTEDSPRVKLGFWMDGKLLHTIPVETKPSKLVFFDPYSEEEMRVYLPEGDHTFRAGFIDDPFVKNLTKKDAYDNKKNKFLNSIVFIGPFPSAVERASRKKILICDPSSGPACVDRIFTTLARRAYRRPVSKNEVAELVRFVNLAKQQGQTVEQGIQLAIEAMLVSPKFLFRIERDPADGQPHAISDYELASRLSYFLWSSMPDDPLFALAAAGKLHEPPVLDAQVKRMLADDRSAAFADNFAGQWLEVRNLDTVKPDTEKFPEWTPELRDAMKTETRMLFQSMLRENRPISEFLNARYTFLNERLAKHYGIEGVTGPEFRRVELTTDQRGGILTQGSLLTVSSYPTRTSVVIRGKYILQNILGAPAPPPPPDVPPLDEAAVGTAMSLRQQMEKHRADPTCASCHSRMDPLGFGLENYNAIGVWRTTDGKFPVDATGTMPDGKTFSGPSEMKAVLLARLPEFSNCLTEKLLTYALGRGLKPYDRAVVRQIDHDIAGSGYGFRDLVFDIVRSIPFQQRRGEITMAQNQNRKETDTR
jgi:mono/diheme cytochrome c family protein